MGLTLFSFIITSPTGDVLDFGTYHNAVVAEDTADAYPVTVPGTLLTVLRHDDDGSHERIVRRELLVKQEG